MATSADSSPPEPAEADRGPAKVLDGLLRSPLSGLAPWIVFSLLSGPGRFEQSVSAALGLALIILWAGSRRGIPVHVLELFGVGYFAVLAVIGIFATEGTTRWMELWAGELTNISLALFAAFTMLIRRPFTLSYARDSTPREHWNSPIFLRINYMITAVWAGSFFFSAVVGFYGDAVFRDSDNFWTGWILQLASTFFAVSFTEFYPDYARAKMLQREGLSSEPPPPITPVFDWIPTFVLITGIVGLVTDAMPDPLGIALVVVGVIGVGAMRRFFPAERTPPAG
jgi:hypothetical protein